MALGSLITAVAGYKGDQMVANSAEQTNRTSLQIAKEDNLFNAKQAAMDRSWQERMDNSSMQRKVNDLRRAHLNPALAYSTGGAPISGGASASSVGVPSLQNPGQAFSQLGSQVGSAVALHSQKAQIDLMEAQASKANAEAGSEIPASVERIKSETGLNTQRAQEVSRNVKMLDIQLSSIDDAGGSMYASNYIESTLQNRIKSNIAMMDEQTQSDTLSSLIKARNDLNYASSIGARNIYNASNGAFGRLMAYFNLGKPIISSAGEAARSAAAVMPFIP